MTLLLRWDAADTVYLSGPPGERYVHFPVEISTTVETVAGVAVSALDPSGNVIVEQTYDGLSLMPDVWSRFSPALLVPDSYFTKTETWTLKVILYVSTAPIATPRVITRTISNTGTGGSSRNLMLAAAGVALILFAFAGKRMLK